MPFIRKPVTIIFMIASMQKITVIEISIYCRILIFSLYGSSIGCSNAKITVEAIINIMMRNSNGEELVTRYRN